MTTRLGSAIVIYMDIVTNTKYIIKLVSPLYPNRRYFLCSVRSRQITKTTHPALARTFETCEQAQQLIDAVAYKTGYKWEIHSYMAEDIAKGRVKEIEFGNSEVAR